jgi:hypothetical protein
MTRHKKTSCKLRSLIFKEILSFIINLESQLVAVNFFLLLWNDNFTFINYILHQHKVLFDNKQKTFDIPFTILKKCINAQIKETRNIKKEDKDKRNQIKIKLNSDLFEEF